MKEENQQKKLPPLPQSKDESFWDDGYREYSRGVQVSKTCNLHRKGSDFLKGWYIDNKDGTVSCKYCSFGAILPAYMIVLNEKIVDLRAYKG